MPTLMRISEVVAEECHLDVDDVLGHRRFKELTWARQLIVLLAREFDPSRSLRDLARHLDRDHTTILSTQRVGRERAREDPDFIAALGRIRARLTSEGV